MLPSEEHGTKGWQEAVPLSLPSARALYKMSRALNVEIISLRLRRQRIRYSMKGIRLGDGHSWNVHNVRRSMS